MLLLLLAWISRKRLLAWLLKYLCCWQVAIKKKDFAFGTSLVSITPGHLVVAQHIVSVLCASIRSLQSLKPSVASIGNEVAHLPDPLAELVEQERHWGQSQSEKCQKTRSPRSLWYMAATRSGNPAPSQFRKSVLAAIAQCWCTTGSNRPSG